MAAATFSFNGEDHTLGNLMRNQIQKNAKVDFCAYSVPHPSEPVCNVRIQMASNSDADVNSALRHGLKRIQKTCDVVEEKFLASVADFKNKN
jgi:DNA-directed RNA polymerases I and III subunit RPAC2